MSLQSFTFKLSEELGVVLQLNMQRGGFTSRGAYLRYLVRKEATEEAPTNLAEMVDRSTPELQDDFDSALLRITGAPAAKRPGLLAILGNAVAAALKPRHHSGLRLRTGPEFEDRQPQAREAA